MSAPPSLRSPKWWQLVALLLVSFSVVEGIRVVLYVSTGHDDTSLSQAALGLLAVLGPTLAVWISRVDGNGPTSQR